MENELSLKNNFGKEVQSSILELEVDDDTDRRKKKAIMKWDRQKRSMLRRRKV